MNYKMKINLLIKKLVNGLGFEVVKLKNSPQHSFLGLKSLPIKTIIDVGANQGQFAEWVLPQFPEAKLYCFEPLPNPFEKLDAWAKQQNGRVVPLNWAIGDEEGQVSMFYHTEHSTSSSLLPSTELIGELYPFTKEQQEVKVDLLTLDHAVEKINDPFDDDIMIKLDVQGFEDRVIRGGSQIFKKAKICIIEVSLEGLYEGQANFKELSFMLYDLGFSYAGNLDQKYEEDGRCVSLDAVFTK
jgi:FkbM family methyltransferase